MEAIAIMLEAIATGSKKLLGTKGIATRNKQLLGGRSYGTKGIANGGKKLLGGGHCY